jgi:hypothetical protein
MDLSASRILRSGWGAFVVVAGVLAVLLDVKSRFYGGSWILGWLLSVGVFIVPAATWRGGLGVIPKWCGWVWCIMAFLAWTLVHGIAAESAGTRPPVMSIGTFGCLVLCWRLLCWTKAPQSNSHLKIAPRYFYRIGPQWEIRGPVSSDDIMILNLDQKMLVVPWKAQTSRELSKEKWIELSKHELPNLTQPRAV